MQTKLIKADGATEYAFARDYSWKTEGGRHNGYAQVARHADRVVVLETGVKRKVYGTGRASFHGHNVPDGIRVRYVESGHEDVVIAKQIRMAWADYAVEENKRRADIKAAADAKLARVSTAGERIKAVLGDHRMPYGFDPTPHGDGSYATGGKVTIDEMARIVEAAFEAGRASR